MRIKAGWSTRELAELAGTTLKTVRHYHRIGLLEEPERAANGYKKYRVAHLIRLLQIRRLVDLGVPLADIAVAQGSHEGAEQMFRALDAELAASIERQQRVRAELAAIMQHPELAELPPGFADIADGLSENDRVFFLLGAQVLEPGILDEMRQMHRPPSAAAAEFAALPEDASEETRQSLAERYAPEIRQDQGNYPQLKQMGEQGAAGGSAHSWSVILQALVELHNPAQMDVLRRVHDILYPDGLPG